MNRDFPSKFDPQRRGTYPVVYFEDLALKPSNGKTCEDLKPRLGVTLDTFEKAYRAFAEDILMLQREMIDIAQRNTNANFGFLRRLAKAKSLGEIVDCQAAYWGNHSVAFFGQAKELQAMVTKVAADLTDPFTPPSRD
jgi:hypothetical protein